MYNNNNKLVFYNLWSRTTQVSQHQKCS